MIPAEVRRRYEDTKDIVSIVADKARDIVRSYCDEHAYAYLGRPKKLESVAEKIETGRFEAWSTLDDLFACVIVVPTASHEDGVLANLEREFIKHSLKRRGEVQQDPEVFRFGATRFVGRLRPSPMDEVGFSSVCFEVQVRTAFEHAWSVTTHDLAYKGDEIRWRLDRLAAQLKAAVEQLDSLVSSYEQSAAGLQEHPYRPVLFQRQILEHFRGHVTAGRIPREVAPDRWGRFAKNAYALFMEKMEQSQAFRRLADHAKVEAVLRACDEEISRSGCPRTISLFQFVLGVLVRQGMITARVRRTPYSLLITQDLETFFPETSAIANRFSVDG